MSLHEALKEAARQHEAGNLAEAETIYEAVLRADPNAIDALQLLGVLRHQQGQHEEGIALLERAHAQAPANPEILSNYGAVLLDQKRIEEAEGILRRALTIDPCHRAARLNLIRLLRLNSWIDDAIIACREHVALAPDDPEFNGILGNLLLKDKGDPEKAMEVYRRCLELDPDNWAFMNDFAICCRELGDYDQAEHWYREALARQSELQSVNFNFGTFLLSLGRTEEARKHLDKVLADDPGNWMTLTMLAMNLVRTGREEEGLAMLNHVADAHPEDPCVLNDIGAQFTELGKFEMAAKMFARAIDLDPARVEPVTNLGNAYMKMHRGFDAIREYEKALKIVPRHLEAHVTICRALRDVYRYDEANLYARATILLPNFRPRYFSNPLQIFHTTCDYEGVAEIGDIWKMCETVDPGAVTSGLLQLLAYAENDETTARLSKIARRWGEEIEKKAAAAPLPIRSWGKTNPKIRLGILSADLRQHSVSRFFLPLFHQCDRERFEFYCYSTTRAEGDPVQAEYREKSDKFVFIDEMSDREAAMMIQADEVDILFDLNGFTTGSRHSITAWRPAPVQISWIGYPFTTALKATDYVLVDEYLKPVGDGGLIEKPLVIQGSWLCFGGGVLFDPLDVDPEPPMARNGVVTFGTLNGTYKYTPKIFALWAEAMKAVPDSRFLLIRPECGSLITCRNIAQEFAKNGISTDRLYFINNRGKNLSHLAYYNEIDIALDTFPITGGTTTTEATWMGVPTVSLVGHAIHQRVSYAILKHCGLDECCADTPEEFVAKVVTLANVDKLRDLRRNMRARLQSSTLARPDLFTKNFQVLMEEVVRQHSLR